MGTQYGQWMFSRGQQRLGSNSQLSQFSHDNKQGPEQQQLVLQVDSQYLTSLSQCLFRQSMRSNFTLKQPFKFLTPYCQQQHLGFLTQQ